MRRQTKSPKKGNAFPLTQLTFQDDFVVKRAALVLCSFDLCLLCLNALRKFTPLLNLRRIIFCLTPFSMLSTRTQLSVYESDGTEQG
jgi:hypothetical protein